MKKYLIALMLVGTCVFCAGLGHAATFSYEALSDDVVALRSVTGLSAEDMGTFSATFYWSEDGISAYDVLMSNPGSFWNSAELTGGAASVLIAALGDDKFTIKRPGRRPGTWNISDGFFAPFNMVPDGTGTYWMDGFSDAHASLSSDAGEMRFDIGTSSGTSDIFVVFSGEVPTPIPGAVWLLGSGLVGLVGVRRKMKA
jgi:hypothetical protein